MPRARFVESCEAKLNLWRSFLPYSGVAASSSSGLVTSLCHPMEPSSCNVRAPSTRLPQFAQFRGCAGGHRIRLRRRRWRTSFLAGSTIFWWDPPRWLAARPATTTGVRGPNGTTKARSTLTSVRTTGPAPLPWLRRLPPHSDLAGNSSIPLVSKNATLDSTSLRYRTPSEGPR